MRISRRSFSLFLAWAGGLLSVGCSDSNAECAGGGEASDTRAGAPVAARRGTPAAFPLSVKSGTRHLVDAAGSPFFLHGDFAASIFNQLTREEVDEYLSDRHRRGFNAIGAALMQHYYARNAPANAYGEAPFLVAGDLGTPNDRYFDHVEWVLSKTAEKGILALIAPAFLGAGGGREGWYRDMVESGSGKLQEFGRYLGRRFHRHRNIVWVHAGDFNPPDKTLVKALADGIRAFDVHSLNTAHCAPDTAAIEYWGSEPWLQLNNVYTYKPVYSAALKQHRRPERMPFILAESRFENEFGGDALLVRTQAYQALLSGACGHLYGNNPIWHFDSPNCPFPAPTTWRQALDSPGARSMTHLISLFFGLEWWLLEPDLDDRLLVSGHGSGQQRAVAAFASDRSFALVYLPSPRSITLELNRLAGPRIEARWYDPTAGTWLQADGSPLLDTRSHRLRPPGCNSADDGDWLLLLQGSE